MVNPIWNKRLAKYDRAQLLYTFRMLIDAGFISCHAQYTKDLFVPFFASSDGLTYQGHQYIANIRDDNVWKKMLQKLAHIGGTASLAVISSVCEGIAKGILDKASSPSQ